MKFQKMATLIVSLLFAGAAIAGSPPMQQVPSGQIPEAGQQKPKGQLPPPGQQQEAGQQQAGQQQEAGPQKPGQQQEAGQQQAGQQQEAGQQQPGQQQEAGQQQPGQQQEAGQQQAGQQQEAGPQQPGQQQEAGQQQAGQQQEAGQQGDTLARLSQAFSFLHFANQASVKLSQMADQRSSSDAVLAYARMLASDHAQLDTKLLAVAAKFGIAIQDLDSTTAVGKSMLDRAQAEWTLLSSLQGDAWDQEYLSLVITSQDRVVAFLESRRSLASNQDESDLIQNMITVVKDRQITALSILNQLSQNEL